MDPLCASTPRGVPAHLVGGASGHEGGVWALTCGQCGRVWIAAAAYERLLDWHDGATLDQQRAARACAAIRVHGRGQGVPIGLELLLHLSDGLP
jgi:hypothetical protein